MNLFLSPVWQAFTVYLGVSSAAAQKSGAWHRNGVNTEGATGQVSNALLRDALVDHGNDSVSVARPAISVVLMNYKRPKNVELLTSKMSNYSNIDEIIVWNNHMHQVPALVQTENLTLMNSPETDFMSKWGLMGRFKACLLARNEWVIVQDDDLLMNEEAIDRLVSAKMRLPDLVTCYESRQVLKQEEPGKVFYHNPHVDPPARVPICLTQNLLTDRRYCLATIRQAEKMEDLGRAGRPYWNGEDILHSLVAQHLSGEAPLVLPRPPGGQTALPAHDAISTQKSTKEFDHYRFRETFTRALVDRLNISHQDLSWRPAPEFEELSRHRTAPRA